MDIRQLRFLVALDETQHFGKAAKSCNVTQLALSSRLHNLEDRHSVGGSHRFKALRRKVKEFGMGKEYLSGV